MGTYLGTDPLCWQSNATRHVHTTRFQGHKNGKRERRIRHCTPLALVLCCLVVVGSGSIGTWTALFVVAGFGVVGGSPVSGFWDCRLGCRVSWCFMGLSPSQPISHHMGRLPAAYSAVQAPQNHKPTFGCLLAA